MSLTKTRLFGELIKNIDIDIKNDDLYNSQVKRVYLNSNSCLKIALLANKIISYYDVDEVKAVLLKTITELSDINIVIEYNIENKKLDYLIKENWNNIIYLIRKEIPSSLSWLDTLQWEANGDLLKLLIGNDIALFALGKKEMDKYISNKLKQEFNIDTRVVFYSYNHESMNEEEHQKLKEEEELSFASNISVTVGNDANQKEKKNSPKNSGNSPFIYGKKVEGEIIKMSEINTSSGTVTLEGEIFDVEVREIKGDKKLYTFNITDFSSSIIAKVFANKKQQEALDDNLMEGNYGRFQGDIVYDNFSKQLVLMIKSILLLNKTIRMDTSVEKRVELHCHSRMSAMDGMTGISEFIKRAADWGHKAIAITDHGVVQSFPEGMEASEQYGVKVLYGVEGYFINDSKFFILNIIFYYNIYIR